MKQKTSMGFCGKVQKTVRLERTERLTGGSRPSGLNFQKEAAGLDGAREPRRSPAVIHGEAGGPEGTSVFRASFRVGWWWWWSPASTVSMAALAPADGGSGEVGDLRWRAAKYELRRGSERVMQGEATGKSMGAAEHTRGRIGLDPVAGRGGRSRGRRLLGALPVARLALGGVQGWWVLELKLGASIYRQIDGVAVNEESLASDYGGAVGWQGV